jgi:hypothetical protein
MIWARVVLPRPGGPYSRMWRQVVFDLVLPDEVLERPRPQADIKGSIFSGGLAGYDPRL